MHLQELLVKIKNLEFSTNTLLTMDLTMELDDLLEITLSEMRTHTNHFQSILDKQQKYTKKFLVDKLEELKQQIYADEDKVEYTEHEIERLNDVFLQKQAVFFKNHSLLNDCKITKEFIRLESRKTGTVTFSSLSYTKSTKTLNLILSLNQQKFGRK